jgi:hypothetical protein
LDISNTKIIIKGDLRKKSFLTLLNVIKLSVKKRKIIKQSFLLSGSNPLIPIVQLKRTKKLKKIMEGRITMTGKTTKTKAKTVKVSVKEILVKEIGKTPEPITVTTEMTLSELFELQGVEGDSYKTITGKKGKSYYELSPESVINGYEQIILTPNGGGGY